MMVKRLTADQQRAAKELNKNVQIIACAGSGKTSTIVERIINILKMPDIEPGNIVAFTFTEKAAAELKERTYNHAKEILGDTTGLADLYIGTIHGYCLQLLQENDPNYLKFQVLNEIQTKLFVDKTYKENGILELQYTDKKGNTTDFKRYKDTNLFIEIVNTVREENILENKKNIPQNIRNAVKMYEEALSRAYYFDYTSIMIEAIKLLKNDKNIKEKVKENLKYLIVDEYQDVNPIQEELIKLIYQLNTNICIVGDDDQILYHWRGSKSENIIEFSQRYNNVESIELMDNFRSSEGIVNSADFLISNNKNRLKKAMKSTGNQTYEMNDIIGYQFNSEEEEIEFIISKIKQLHGLAFKDTPESEERGLSYSDISILVYSVKKIPQLLIDRLQQEEIEFVVEGMKNLFETPEIQACVNIFEFLNNSYELDDLKKDWAKYAPNEEFLEEGINYLQDNIPNNEMAWEEFVLQEVFSKFLGKIGLYEITGYRSENILYNIAKFTHVINDYEFINLKTSPINRIEGFCNFLKYAAHKYYPEGWLSPAFKKTNGLKIMTFFQAKGLEFPVVFMPFLTQSYMFPPKKGGKNKWQLLDTFIDKEAYESNSEDLRRIFYVGVTRSKKFLFMSQSPNPYGNGKFYRKPAGSFVEIMHSDYVSQDISCDYSDRKKALVSTKKDQIQYNYDFSTISSFFECPTKFKYTSVYGFIQPLSFRMGYGQSIHNMLDDLHRNYRDLSMPTNEIVEILLKRHFYLPYARKKLWDSMKERAREDITNYIRLNRQHFDKIIYIEKQIEISLADNIFVNGRIDLVRNTATNQTIIVDFKSDKKVQSEELIRDQLAIYALGYKKLTGEMPDLIQSYTFSGRTPNNYIPKEIKVTGKLLNDIEEKIKKVSECIENDDYKRIKNFGESNPTCDKCDYKDSCLKSILLKKA